MKAEYYVLVLIPVTVNPGQTRSARTISSNSLREHESQRESLRVEANINEKGSP